MQDNDAQLLENPNVSAEELARVAATRPDLHAKIAANPAAYPELLEWLAHSNDPAVQAVLAARQDPESWSGSPSQAPPQPAPSQTSARNTRKWLWPGLVAGLALILAGVGLWVCLDKKDSGQPGSSSATLQSEESRTEELQLEPDEQVEEQVEEETSIPPVMNFSEISRGDYTSIEGTWADDNGDILEITPTSMRYFAEWADTSEPTVAVSGNTATLAYAGECRGPGRQDSEGALVLFWECDVIHDYDFWAEVRVEFAPPGVPIHVHQYVYTDEENYAGEENEGLEKQRLVSDQGISRIFLSTGGYSEALPEPYKYTAEPLILTRLGD